MQQIHLTGNLTIQQQERLLLQPGQIEVIQRHTYVPQHEVRAELTRVFGHGRWDSQVVEMVLLFESWQEDEVKRSGNTTKEFRWHVGYRAGVRLRVRDPRGFALAEFVEYHCDETIHPTRGEAHSGAITSAESYALRRAAIGLGDRFGLSLYAKDDQNGQPLVKGTLPLFAEQKALADASEPQPQAPAAEEAAPETVVRVPDPDAAGYDPMGLDGGDK